MLARKRHIKHEKHKRQRQNKKHKKIARLSLASVQHKSSTVKRSSTGSIAQLLQNVTRIGAALAAASMAKADEVTLTDPEGRIYELFCSLKCDDLVDIATKGGFDVKHITTNLTDLPHRLVGDYKCVGNRIAHIFQNGSIPLNTHGEYLRSQLNYVQNECNILENYMLPFAMTMGGLGVLVIIILCGALCYKFYCKREEYEPVATHDTDIKLDDPATNPSSDLEAANYQANRETAPPAWITEVTQTSRLNRT